MSTTDFDVIPEILSIDLSNRCSKGCAFCYNGSNPDGVTEWDVCEAIAFLKDCASNGIKAISLGGGEPFEYPGVFKIIEELYPLVYLSVTSNGLPLMSRDVVERLSLTKPDKIHISVHRPADLTEVDRVISQLQMLNKMGITPGVNLLIRKSDVVAAREAYRRICEVVAPTRVILLPMRYGHTPSAVDVASVAEGRPFQSPSCLLKCNVPTNFVSVTFDKCVGRCSYTSAKTKLENCTFAGLMSAIRRSGFKPCS